MYSVYLSEQEIGETALEFADPPMGVVFGMVSFYFVSNPFHFFLRHCTEHGVAINNVEPEIELIRTQTIPGLRVVRKDGVEIRGSGCSIEGMKEEGYEITIFAVPYPFYGEEFPHHCRAYDEQFLQ